VRGEILLLPGAQARAVKKGGSALRSTSAPLEEIMRAALRHGFKEVGDSGKASMLVAIPEERELRLVVGVLVDLAVIELGDADGLRRFEEHSPLSAEPRIRREIPVLGDPGGERRGRHAVAALRLQLRRSFGERVAEVVEGDAVENDAERIGLGAELRRRGREATAA
jgi:hypothetical protein